MIIEITPDVNLNNNRLESMLTNIHTYKNLLNRINLKDKKILPQTQITYEILFSKENISFYYIISDTLEELVKNELNVCYPKATFKFKNDNYRIEKDNGILNVIKENHMIEVKDAIELELDQHSFLSLKTDLRAEYPLNSFLETSKVLKENENVLLQYILIPCEPSTSTDFESAIKEFNEGKLLEKHKLDGRKIAKTGLKLAYSCIAEVMDLASLIITNQEYERLNLDELDNNILFRNGLSQNTKDKSSSLCYDTSIRISTDSSRSDLILKLFQRAFNLMQGDNKLVPRKVDKSELLEAVKERKVVYKFNEDALSTKELAQLIQLPTKYYQQEYKIKNIDIMEINIPPVFTAKGVQIGWTVYKGNKIPVFFPLDDLDSLCQCWLSIGKMGSGKTTCGENTAIQLLKNDISVFAIDVADGSMIDNIAKGLPESFSKIVDLDFGDISNPIPLSWSEAALCGEDRTMETKLASQLKNFLNKLSKTETSDRMERFLGAAAKAVFKNPNANLYDVILCLTDKNYRHKIIKENNIDGRLKYTLEQLDDDKTGTKPMYISGIMDRLEALLDNEYVANCLLQKANPDINFRKWADEGYFVGIRIPKDTLLDDATDLLVTYVVSKLWLAILSRHNIPKEKRKPCMLFLDEPHQFPTVLKELYSIIREMRKWRFGTFIFAHEFGDFKNMKTLLKSAGTNYFIYSTSKETYKELLEELQPFDLEAMLKTKWHHAIVNMRYKEEQVCVMTDMLKPLPKKNNYKPVNVYGNPIKDVENYILERC